MAERSMVRAHAENVKAGNTDYFTVDGGYTAPRNAHGCTMAAHAPDGRVVDVVHKRLTDVGAKSSQSLEILCYVSLLACVRVAVYGTSVFDGCRELIAPTLAAGKRAQAELWHVGKNWAAWFALAVVQLCKRPQKTAAERADNPKVAEVKVDAARIEKPGSRPHGEDVLAFLQRRVREIGGEPPADADAAALKKLFGQLARLQAMTAGERAQETRREAYLAEEARRKAASQVRTQERGNVAAAERAALAWKRDLRGMQRYVAEHTRSLRFTPNPASADGAHWTDVERAAEFKRLWRKGCVALVLGRRNDATLKLLKHPITEVVGAPGVERLKPWEPKGAHRQPWATAPLAAPFTPWSPSPAGDGFVALDTLAFDVLYSAIHDPVCTT
jgi:hypothetical protein